MEVSWDADNFEPKLPTTLTTSNKWEGEDEEEAVKESWEDEEEEKKDEEKKDLPAAPTKPKKKIQEKIAEKERLEREKAERLAAERAEAEADMTPEERAAEKLRQQKLQEESDLRLAMETFGISETGGGKLDSYNPNTKAEFTELADMLSKKVCLYKAKEEFPAFVEDLFRNIVVQMQSADIKRIKLSIDNLYIEKQKAEKNDKAKKPAKGKGKAKLKLDSDNAHLNPEVYAGGNFDDDYDDFM